MCKNKNVLLKNCSVADRKIYVVIITVSNPCTGEEALSLSLLQQKRTSLCRLS